MIIFRALTVAVQGAEIEIRAGQIDVHILRIGAEQGMGHD